MNIKTVLFCIFATAGACGAQDAEISFEEFKTQTYQESATGLYIVDGDIPVASEGELRAFYQELRVGTVRQGLTVNQRGGSDDRWSNASKRSISYCVSSAFGSNYGAVVQAMLAGRNAWEQATSVRLVYRGDQDGACNAGNTAVTFDVSPTSGQPYLARAFFPSSARPVRNILIDSSSFGNISPYTLGGILRHEIGHVLGFRHEHTRPEAATCFEDNNWRALTTYDSASVMHYPQCNGDNSGDLLLTQRDRDGARILYGHPIAANFLADLNGDHKADGVADNDSNIWVIASNGASFNAPALGLSGAFYGSRAMQMGDINGDGLADGVAFNDGDIWVTLSTGSSFSAPARWLPVSFYGTRATLLADVNGDGRADGVAFNDGDIWVTLSTGGSGFSAPARWLPVSFYGTRATLLADVNGDGRVDSVAFNDGDIWVTLSTGAGFGAPARWLPASFYGTRATLLADVNGDRRADGVAFNDGDVWVTLSTGLGFSSPTRWLAVAFYGSH